MWKVKIKNIIIKQYAILCIWGLTQFKLISFIIKKNNNLKYNSSQHIT